MSKIWAQKDIIWLKINWKRYLQFKNQGQAKSRNTGGQDLNLGLVNTTRRLNLGQ